MTIECFHIWSSLVTLSGEGGGGQEGPIFILLLVRAKRARAQTRPYKTKSKVAGKMASIETTV